MCIILWGNFVLNWRLLTAFEAVARNRSFTLAANELNVQQPAISRRIADLEEDLGITLVLRTKPQITLTREGMILYRSVAATMAEVQNTIEQIRQRSGSKAIRVDVTIGFASCYLIKRLPDFQIKHPEISVELVSRDQNENKDETSDVVIAFDHPQNSKGKLVSKIFGERMVAVAAPTVSIPDDLRLLSSSDLLHLNAGIHAKDWETFFEGTGVQVRTPRTEQKFTSFMVYLQAALDGAGVILGWETLLDEYFSSGLLRPVSTRRVETPRGYFAYLGLRTQPNQAASTFINWLSEC